MGALYGVGNCGYSWSATIHQINGFDLDFRTTWSESSYPSRRGYGFQLRCLSE
ncbi:hypothetical protein [uncultured Rikenella sp.]|uniref:hypothetical protein n=1 Tax=uncultured Rikenella sp. TaxID=368003 RepID=UPI0025F9D38C|nr:hypothetical protein [uncultured Rikenella sp.]